MADKKFDWVDSHYFNRYGVNIFSGLKVDSHGRTQESYYMDSKFTADGICKTTGTRYDEEGYDTYGLDKYGFDRNHLYLHKHLLNPQGYHYDGYDRRGFDRFGINRETGTIVNRTGCDVNKRQIGKYFGKDGYNTKTGFDRYGYDREGFNKAGFNLFGYHRQTLTKFDPEGFDFYGFDAEGFDRNNRNKFGFDRDGYRDGYDQYGFDRNGFDYNGYDHNGYRPTSRIDEYGFCGLIHIKQTTLTGKISYVDEEGFNHRGYHYLNGKSRSGTEVDKAFIIASDFIENHGMSVPTYAELVGLSESEVCSLLRRAKRLYPHLADDLSRKNKDTLKVIYAIILDDMNSVTSGKISVEEFWRKHKKLSIKEANQMYERYGKYDETLMRFYYTILLRSAPSIDDTCKTMFTLTGSRYNVEGAISAVAAIHDRALHFGIRSQKDRAIRNFIFKKCGELDYFLKTLKSKNYRSIYNTTITFPDGRTVVYDEKLITDARQRLKERKEYVCLATVMHCIENET